MQKLNRNEIAQAWGCHPTRVSKVKTRAARCGQPMPAFRTPAEAKRWKETFDSKGAVPVVAVEIGGDMPDLSGLDFDEAQARRAELALDLADKLFRSAAARGHHGEVAKALRNLTDAHEGLARVRERHLANQTKAGELVSVDEAKDVLVVMLSDIRHSICSLGERLATKLNPGDPAAARAILDEAVDRILVKCSEGSDRVAGQLERRLVENEERAQRAERIEAEEESTDE